MREGPGVGFSCATDRSSRANSSYMYLNYVQVVNTRSSSALPNRRFSSCWGPRGKFNRVADHIQHHKFSNSRRAWSFCRWARFAARRRRSGRR